MEEETDQPSSNIPKKPCKGILKTSSSFDHTGAGSKANRKSAKFDELNVLETYHPPDKDYGHMKVEEPKTPYNYVDNTDIDVLDAELLAEKLRVAAAESSSEEEEEVVEETEEQKAKRLEFERRRKMHYNEFQAVKLARKLLEADEENDEAASSGGGGAADSKSKLQKMEVEEKPSGAGGSEDANH